MGLFSFIGNAVKGVLGLGGGSPSTSTNYAKELANLKAEMTKQMNFQAQESKKTLMFVGIGAVALIMIMFLFMKK